ncbi:MAG: hypothetical protein RL198_983 [Actinomycetota bacterium]|jgi:large subunit ribosomal protein L9
MPKVILTNQVSGLGAAGDVVDVKAGYARNYLIPKGFAVAWTKGGEKQVAQIRAARESRLHADEAQAQALKDALEAKAIRIEVKAGKEGRLFGAVKHGDVATAIAAAGLGQVDKRKIEFAAPIRNVGSHRASVKIGDLSVALTLEVVAAK